LKGAIVGKKTAIINAGNERRRQYEQTFVGIEGALWCAGRMFNQACSKARKGKKAYDNKAAP
jgi:hypothetical protein